MSPISPFIAAGAAWGAAKDQGLNDMERLHVAKIAAETAEKEAGKEKAEAAELPVRPLSPPRDSKPWWQIWRR